MKDLLLVITPIKHIKDLYSLLESKFQLIYKPNFTYKDLNANYKKVKYIFTNPNKSNVYINDKFIKNLPNLTAICTASTGTNHIDKKIMIKKNVSIISLTKEYKVIKKISSTSELAITFSLMAARNVIEASSDVLNKKWNYEKFIGRQFNGLKIGVIGYGRLGKIYVNIMLALGAKIYVFDPYKLVKNKKIIQTKKISELFIKSDIISIHVHINEETNQMINYNLLKKASKDLILINTSRGEIINEKDMCNFLKKNKNAKLFTDVLSDEVNAKFNSLLFKYFKKQKNSQIFITPHIGGMTIEAQHTAFTHAAKLLIKFSR